MINKNSHGYRIGRFIGKITLITIGYLMGKSWGRRPINDFPKK